jgi:hypothetical protein
MSLLPHDQLYLQRSQGGSKLYDKYRVSVEELESFILGGYQDGVTDINDRLDQEIQDRIDGDLELVGQVDDLTDRIRVISGELYDTLVQHEYEYRIDNNSKANYDILVANNCAGLVGEDFTECNKNQLNTYVDSIAGSQLADSRGGIYLATNNYTYKDTISIFLSDTASNGDKIDLEQATVGSLIEMINITQATTGEDIIDNYNYGFYKILEIGEKKEEYNEAGSFLYRFDVEYIGSAPRDGKPSVQSGENRFLVKLIIDLQSTLDEVYVNKIGDDMSGSLNISITDDTDPEGAALTPGLVTTNSLTGANLTLTGYPDPLTPNVNPDSIDITNPKETTVRFHTEENVNLFFESEWQLSVKDEMLIKYNFAVVDGTTGEEITPKYVNITERVVFDKSVEYLHTPNLLNPQNAGNQNLIPPRHYVDYMDSLLDNKITDVSQRIDTLANASDVYAFRMILPDESEPCATDLENGLDSTQSPPVYYPGYDPLDPTAYDPTTLSAGYVWAECTRGTIDGIDPAVRGAFDWKSFNQEYVDSNGVTQTREVDLFILSNKTNILDENNTDVTLDYNTVINIGDYLEVSASDARTTAYAIYRITEADVDAVNNIVIITGQTLYKSNDPIQVGYNYKIKFYDKSKGLDINDTNALYVNLTGDIMTGPLGMKTSTTTAQNLLYIEALDGTEVFNVNNEGDLGAKSLRLYDDAGSREIASLIENELTFNSNTKPITFKASGSIKRFHFVDSADSPVFEINNDQVDIKNKRISGVMPPVSDDEAVNRGWLTGKNGGELFLQSMDKTLEFKELGSNGRIDGKIGIVPIGKLSDVYIHKERLQDAHALLYNQSESRWEVSEDKIEAFIPGKKVAYTGNYPDSYVEVGGFWLNTTTGTLLIRTQ